MPRGSAWGRLARLEALAPKPPRSSGARETIRAKLDRLAAARRGELPPEEAEATIREARAALERARARRGEGGR